MTEGIYHSGAESDPARKVVCPECKAAIGASCTRPVLNGSKFVDYYHQSRIEKAAKE